MKSRLLILTVFFFQQLSAQNDSCVTTRWLMLNEESNSKDFHGFWNKSEFWADVQTITNSGKILWFSEYDNFFEPVKLYFPAWFTVELDSTNYKVMKYYPVIRYFALHTSTERPLVDRNGEDPIVINTQGMLEYVYMGDSVSLFNESWPTLLIREDLIEGKFRATGISFYTYGHRSGGPGLWLDLQTLSDYYLTQKPEWLEALEEKYYKGFQYKQVGCR